MNDHARYLATRHFGSLDGLRFLCITAVIWHHTPVWQEIENTGRLVSRGFVGVDFFFVLSGYLITTLLLREKSVTGRLNLRGFYWRRALRILPIYYLVVTVAGLYAIAIKSDPNAPGLLPYYYLFLANFLIGDINYLTPTWSLSVEEQYYLLWPALLLVLPQRWIVPALLLLIAVNVAAAMDLFTPFGISAIQLPNLSLAIEGATYAPILLGSLAAVLLHFPRSFSQIAPLLRPRLAPLGGLLLLLVLLGWLPSKLEGWPNLIVHLLMTFTLMTLVIREDNGLASVLKLRPIVRIGQVSYGIYLYHLFARAGATEVLKIEEPWTIFAITYLLSVVIAEISFRLLETPILKLRHKHSERVPAVGQANQDA